MSDQAKVVVRVLGEELAKFEADNICLRRTEVKQMGGQIGHRSEFTEWHDVPYIATGFDGLDATGKFNEITGIAVPHRVNVYFNDTFRLTNTDTLDASELARKVRASLQAVDNRINRAVANAVAIWGSQTVTDTAALSGFQNIADIETLLIEQDVSQTSDKTSILNPRDYNAMAKDLQIASRTLERGSISETAYEKASIAEIAGMDTFKTSFTPVKSAAAGGATTVDGAQSYVPTGATEDAEGNPTNVDNRTMTLTVDNSAGVVAGDKFTIAAVNALSLQNKSETGELRTFSVVSVPAGGVTLEISPPIIPTVASPTTTDEQAQRDYANCDAGAADTAVLTWLNIADAKTNLFWENEAVCINTAPVVGSEEMLGGMILMNETTERGLSVIVAKQGDINDLSTNWRVTTFFGVTVRDPMKCGILIGGQT
jgi:hypothetical protein